MERSQQVAVNPSGDRKSAVHLIGANGCARLGADSAIDRTSIISAVCQRLLNVGFDGIADVNGASDVSRTGIYHRRIVIGVVIIRGRVNTNANAQSGAIPPAMPVTIGTSRCGQCKHAKGNHAKHE